MFNLTLQSKYFLFNSANFLQTFFVLFLVFLLSQLLRHEIPFFFFGHLPYHLAVRNTHFVGLKHD